MAISRIPLLTYLFGHFLFLNILLAQAPTVVSTTPIQNALNILLESPIAVTFDQNMDATNINTNTMVVTGNYTGLIAGNYSTVGATTTFTPIEPFMVGERIDITLSTGVTSLAGDTLLIPYIWVFTAEALGGSGEFADAVNYPGPDPHSVTVADLDGDGDADLAVVNNSGSTISVLLNSGSGSYANAINYSVGSGPYAIIAADLNGDGDVDLAISNIGSGTVSVMLNNNSGGYADAVNYGVGSGPPVHHCR